MLRRQLLRKTRRSSKKLRKAERSSRPAVDGPLTEGQKEFAEVVARRTGLSPRVVAAQVLAEMSGPFAREREAEGNHNWLNVAYFDSGPGSITKDPVWSSPRSAARASADFYKGKRFGASQGIRDVLKSAGKSDEAQIQAIAGSGWASSGYDGGDSLRGTADLISVREGSPQARRKARRARGALRRVERRADRAGLEGVERKARVARTGGEGAAPRRKRGPFAGSRRMVSRILGQPVHGDKEPGHAAGGDHDPATPGAYAQDIGSVGGNPAEGEGGLGWNQETVSRAARRIRRLGGSIPKGFRLGQDWEGTVAGYRIQLLTAPHGTGPHVHLGARWVGGTAPSGTVSGGGSTRAFVGAVAEAAGVSRQVAAERLRDDPNWGLRILRQLGFTITPGRVASPGGRSEPKADIGRLKKRYLVKL